MSRPARGLLTSLVTHGSGGPERVADGVWRLRVNPGRLNLFFLEEPGGGVTQFDAGGRVNLALLRSVLVALGPLRRVILSHAHTDHRGSAPLLGSPVVCHPDEVLDAQGTGGMRYWGKGLPKLRPGPRLLHRVALQRLYDGGPVHVANTVADGDQIAGFRVLHVPGRAPGLIALIRERDGVALVSDAVYTVDAWWRDCRPYTPGPEWSWDVDRARASLRRLATFDLAIAWPGHGEPITGDVPAALLAASRR